MTVRDENLLIGKIFAPFFVLRKCMKMLNTLVKLQTNLSWKFTAKSSTEHHEDEDDSFVLAKYSWLINFNCILQELSICLHHKNYDECYEVHLNDAQLPCLLSAWSDVDKPLNSETVEFILLFKHFIL